MFIKSNHIYLKLFVVAFVAYNIMWFFGDDIVRLTNLMQQWIF